MASSTENSEPGSGKPVIAYDQRLAKAVVRVIKGLPVTPNALTALGMLIGIVSGFLYAEGTRGTMIAGSLLFMVAVWMDHVDGEFARATGKTSKFGHYFDHVGAMTSYCSMFVGAGFGLRDTWVGEYSVLCGIVAGISIALIFSIRLWQETVYGGETTVMTVRGGFEVEDTLYIAGPITWFGLMPYFIAAAGIGAPIYLLVVIWEAAGYLRRKP